MPEQAMLLTFLGRPQHRDNDGVVRGYVPSCYALDDRTSPVVRYPSVGIALGLDPRPAEVHVLATPEAWGGFHAHLEGDLEGHELPVPVHHPLPSGGHGESDAWGVFQTINGLLRAAHGRRVVLDVTNGYRVQPLLAAAAALFRRAVSESALDVRLLYAAWEAREPGGLPVTPVWDVTSFLDVVDWATALRTFLRTGHAVGWTSQRVASLGSALAREWARGPRTTPRPDLDLLGKALARFGSDLTALRTGDLLLGRGREPASARALLDAIAAAGPLVTAHLPALAEVLDELEAMATALQPAAPGCAEAGALDSEAGHRALVELAELHLRQHHHVEAAIVAREAWVTRFADSTAACPGRPGFRDARRRAAEREWFRWADRDEVREAASVRNTLAHAGFQGNAPSAERVVRQCEGLVRAARDAGRVAPGDRSAGDASTGLLANVTSHAIAGWSTEQRVGAEELANHLYDLPFPHVEPEWEEEKLDEGAEDVAKKCREGTTHALVMGEYALTVRIVQRLQQRGVTCVVTRQRRDVIDLGDGRREQRFAFLGFREYPLLG